MTKETRDYTIEKSKELIASPTCSSEAKAAAQAWIEAAGTDREEAETKAYIAELEADIVTVDGLRDFALSPMGAQVFGGEEAAKGVAAHAMEIKEKGALYCDCPACAAVEAILKKKELLLD